MRRTLAVMIILGVLFTACGGSDEPIAVDLSDDLDTSFGEDTEAGDNPDDSVSSTSSTACPSEPFDGTVTREVDESSGHTSGIYGTPDFTHSKGISIGASNYTTYIASHEIGGGTVVAEPGGIVVTMFVFGDGVDLTPGLVLDAAPGPVVDNSGAAEATTTNGSGTITIIEATDSHLCYDIAYSDDFQQILGTVSIEL